MGRIIEWPLNPTQGQIFSYRNLVSGCDWINWLYLDGAWEEIDERMSREYEQLNFLAFAISGKGHVDSKEYGVRDRPIRRANGELEN